MNIYLTDSDEEAIVDFVKDHEVLCNKTNGHFWDKGRNACGRAAQSKSGQAPKEMTGRTAFRINLTWRRTSDARNSANLQASSPRPVEPVHLLPQHTSPEVQPTPIVWSMRSDTTIQPSVNSPSSFPAFNSQPADHGPACTDDLYLFGFQHCFQQHCIGHITTGSFMGSGNKYIQLVKVLYCQPKASSYQLSHLRSGWELNFDLRGGRRECNHSATMAPFAQMKTMLSSFLKPRQETTRTTYNYLAFEVEALEDRDFQTFRNEAVKLLRGIHSRT